MKNLGALLPDKASLRKFLTWQGWRTRPHSNNRIELFEKRQIDGHIASVVVPVADDASNADRMIDVAVNVLAQDLKISTQEVTEQIHHWQSDVLTIRVLDNIRSISNLPLDVASNTLVRLKQLMGYAAYTETNPQPFFEKAGSISSEFASCCRFGHTFRGSFGMKIEVPFNYDAPLLPMEDNPPDPPFERQVTQRIAAGLSNLRAAGERDSVEPLLDGFFEGCNANMLRMFVETYEDLNGAQVEYDFKWSAQLRSDLEESWEPFIFEGKAYEHARIAIDKLEKVEELSEHVVIGHVTVLKSDMPPALDSQQQFEHIITMYWERERGLKVRIRVPLNPADYISACDAHKDGRRIRVFGYPEKRGKFWVLNRAHGFSAHL